MKAMLYINAINGGGAERVITVIANSFAQCDIQTILITSFKDTWEYPVDERVSRIILDADGVIQNKVQKNFLRINKLRKLCLTEKPDVLISFMEEPNYRALVAAIGTKVKTVISVRTDPYKAYRAGLSRLLAKTLYRLADGYVFQTERAKSWFAPSIQKRAAVIPNPVSDGFYHINAIPGNERRIVATGRLTEGKRFNILLDAFSLITEKYPDYKLSIYGCGELDDALKKQITELGLHGRAELLGQCGDIPNAIKDASLFVMSSSVEGLPNSLMEAMVLGLPIVATDCAGGGARALIDNGKSGLIVPVDDAEKLASAMDKVLGNTALARKLGTNAKIAADSFRTVLITKQWIEYITHVLRS